MTPMIPGIEDRVGRFLVSDRDIRLYAKDPRLLETIFRDLFIMKCEYLCHRRAYEYIALDLNTQRPRFAICIPGTEAPNYSWNYIDGMIEWKCAEPMREIVKASSP